MITAVHRYLYRYLEGTVVQSMVSSIREPTEIHHTVVQDRERQEEEAIGVLICLYRDEKLSNDDLCKVLDKIEQYKSRITAIAKYEGDDIALLYIEERVIGTTYRCNGTVV